MILDSINKMFQRSFEKEWYETYWAFDLHGTIIKPSYTESDLRVIYYPYAKECLKILTERKDIIMILWTSSFPAEIEKYIETFEKDGIHFDAINKNPGISSNNGNFGYYEDKFYFNVLFEDKAGFNPDKEWKSVYEYLIESEIIGYLPNPEWTTKY
jgi:hypothetical protein